MSDSRTKGSRALSGAGAALVSALLFGITTPVAKQLLVGTSPLLIAGLLYAGSGLGLTLLTTVQERGRLAMGLARADWPWLAATVVIGGILGPALLMAGLAGADAAVASLLLNMEMAFTALVAWLLFHEATSRRMVLGLLTILAGSSILFWPGRFSGHAHPASLLAITAACLCWAVDNNLTRRISTGDARTLAAVKGLVAGLTNTGLAVALGAASPPVAKLLLTLVLGFLGYGVSLVLFVFSLRTLGTARTSAYFATAPFIGSALAILLYGQSAGAAFWLAVLCMGVGVWLHLTEHHEHEHVHETLTHTHAHTHDIHHQHEHGHGAEEDHHGSHSHEHRHEPLRHSHPHFPDIHHRHTH